MQYDRVKIGDTLSKDIYLNAPLPFLKSNGFERRTYKNFSNGKNGPLKECYQRHVSSGIDQEFAKAVEVDVI